jgi:hypothetical protein
MNRASIRSLADLQRFDFTETSLSPDGRRLARPEKFSTEGLSGALTSLLETCPLRKDVPPKDLVAKDLVAKDLVAKDMTPLQTGRGQDSAAK